METPLSDFFIIQKSTLSEDHSAEHSVQKDMALTMRSIRSWGTLVMPKYLPDCSQNPSSSSNRLLLSFSYSSTCRN